MTILKNVSNDFVDIFQINTDKYFPAYIQFEAVSDKDYLNEGQPTRGNNCTSVDALIYAKHKDDSKWVIPIEWKYTEFYNNQNKAIEGFKADPLNCKGEVRKKRYTDLINNSKQLINTDHSCFYFEPFYQLMRQTLWAEQMIKNKDLETIKADNYLHIHVIPSENKDLPQEQKQRVLDAYDKILAHDVSPEGKKLIPEYKIYEIYTLSEPEYIAGALRGWDNTTDFRYNKGEDEPNIYTSIALDGTNRIRVSVATGRQDASDRIITGVIAGALTYSQHPNYVEGIGYHLGLFITNEDGSLNETFKLLHGLSRYLVPGTDYKNN